MKKFTLLFAFICATLSVWAVDFTVDGIHYAITSSVSPYAVAVTYKSPGYSGNVAIPASVASGGITYTVTSINNYAFQNCSGLTSVTIPSSVTSIGAGAFQNCSGLTSVTIPSSVNSIGRYAFSNTAWLENNQSTGVVYVGKIAYTYKGTMPANTHINLDEGTSGIADYAFQGCSGLTSVTIPPSVISIGVSAFSDCLNLTTVNYNATNCLSMGSSSFPAFQNCPKFSSLTFGDNVTNIPAYAFNSCGGLLSITIPTSVTSINNNAFSNCSALTSVTIPSLVAFIGNAVFYGCRNLISVTIPSSVTSIGNDTFSGCSSLTSITIPSSVTSIGSSAFLGCSGLTSITIPSSVTSIGMSAFQACSGLASVTIPSSVTFIGDGAFRFLSARINVSSDNSAYSSIDDVLYNKLQTTLIQCPTSKTSILIPSTVSTLGGGAFWNCTGMASVTIPSSVTTIENYAFNSCSGLTSVAIPSSVISIGNSAFHACTGLTSITIPSSVVHIGVAAFQSCSGLISITIPSSVITIADYAFSYCYALREVYAYSTIPIMISSETFSYVDQTACILYVPSGRKAVYHAAPYWRNFTNIVEMTTAVPQIHGREIQPVYNAVTGTLQLTGLEESATIALYNMQGRLVYSGVCNNATCRVSALPAGVYVLKVTVGKETATMKVVM